MSGYFISQGGLRNQHYIDDTRVSNDELWWLSRRNRSIVSCQWCGKVAEEHHDGQSKCTFVECAECAAIGKDTYELQEREPDYDAVTAEERLARYKRMK